MATRSPTTKVLCLLATLTLVATGCSRIRPAAGPSEQASRVVFQRSFLQAVDSIPSWSPDGHKLVFCTCPGYRSRGPTVLSRVHVLDLATGSDTRPGSGWPEIRAGTPGFAPDGLGIVILADDPRRSVVWRAIGSSESRVLFAGARGVHTGFRTPSPDGRYLAVREMRGSEADGYSTDALLVDMKTRTERVLWGGRNRFLSGFRWLANGSLVWDGSDLSAEPDAPQMPHALYVSAPPSWKVRRMPPIPELMELDNKCSSPDGHRLVGYLPPTKELLLRIYVVDVATGAAKTIAEDRTAHVDFGAGCTWSPDGRWIAYGVYRPSDDKVSVRLVSPDGKKTVDLLGPTSSHVEFLSWSPDSRQIAYVQDGSLMVISVP